MHLKIFISDSVDIYTHPFNHTTLTMCPLKRIFSLIQVIPFLQTHSLMLKYVFYSDNELQVIFFNY